METIKLNFGDFQIVPNFESVHREALDDEAYFGSKYASFISNSRLGLINPDQQGSPQKYKEGFKSHSSSLSLGSFVHGKILTPDEFFLAPKCDKPGSKLGMVLDQIDKLLHSKKEFDSFNELVKQAALDIDYYSNAVEAKLEFIKNAWYDYSKKLEYFRNENPGKVVLTLPNVDWDKADACIKSLEENREVMSRLHPIDVFGDPIESYFEDALFMDYVIIYQGKQCTTLRFKLKIDNWTIDPERKVVTLNDLKTTGKSVNYFMDEGKSFYHYCYYRQLGIYSKILWDYLTKTRGVTKNTGWTLNANILAVETIPNYWSKCFSINNELLKKGIKEANELLKRVAACEIFGYDNEYIFE